MFQVTIALAHFIPRLQLAIEEAHHGRITHRVTLTLNHQLTSMQFHCAQTILIQVVGIDLLYGKGCIRIASPTSAKIEFGIDSTYTVMSRKHQP